MHLLLHGVETKRLKFRALLSTDYEQWLNFFRDPASHQHWISERTTPEQDCTTWYARQAERNERGEGGMNALMEKSTGKLVGHCGLLKQTVDGIQEIEIGYSLLPDSWGKGFASEAAIKCKEFAFESIKLHTLISIISVTNKPSEKVALKVGMRLDKSSVYKGNHVNIFRIDRDQIKQSLN